MATTGPVRVLVVDDSAFMRKVLTGILENDPDIQVLGTARDGLDAVEKAVTLRPDVITLDVEMPRLDGLGALREIMAKAPCSVLMVSSLTQRGAQVTIQALAAGAIDFVTKPSGSISLDLHRVAEELLQKVKMVARITRRPTPTRFPAPMQSSTFIAASGERTASAPSSAPKSVIPASVARPTGPWLTVVAASTGGPGALHRLLGRLPAGLKSSMLIVQHMPPGFTAALADHLDKAANIKVKEAAVGDKLTEGVALLAPGGKHLVLTDNGTVDLVAGPPRHNVRPAADITLESIPLRRASRTVAIILTGMGMDGAVGARMLRDNGAQVWVQDEASCVVFGMPKAVLGMGAADRIGTPEEIADWLGDLVGGGKR